MIDIVVSWPEDEVQPSFSPKALPQPDRHALASKSRAAERTIVSPVCNALPCIRLIVSKLWGCVNILGSRAFALARFFVEVKAVEMNVPISFAALSAGSESTWAYRWVVCASE